MKTKREEKAPATKNTLVDRGLFSPPHNAFMFMFFANFIAFSLVLAESIDSQPLVHESWKSAVPGAIKFHVVFERNQRWA